jgi:hypothetical protein
MRHDILNGNRCSATLAARTRRDCIIIGGGAQATAAGGPGRGTPRPRGQFRGHEGACTAKYAGNRDRSDWLGKRRWMAQNPVSGSDLEAGTSLAAVPYLRG